MKLQEESKFEGNTAIMEMVETIVFRSYNNKGHKIDWMPERTIEAALKPIWDKVEFIERGKA